MYTGQTQFVTNKQRRFGAAEKYVAVYLQPNNDVKPAPYLFTETQLKDAQKRAKENREDIPEYSGTPLNFALLVVGLLIGAFIGFGISLFL